MNITRSKYFDSTIGATRQVLFILIVLLVSQIYLSAQKININEKAFLEWPSLGDASISNDGNYALYTLLNIPAYSQTLVLRSTREKWQFEFVGASEAKITYDSKWTVFKTENDSLFLIRLGTGRKTFIKDVKSYKLTEDEKSEWIAYLIMDSVKTLILYNLISGSEKRFAGVIDYTFNKNGKSILLQIEQGKNVNILKWVHLSNMQIHKIWEGQKAQNYSFDLRGEQLSFISTQTKGDSLKYSLCYYRDGMNESVVKVNDNSLGTAVDLRMANVTPKFSMDGENIFFKTEQVFQNKLQSNPSQVDVWGYRDTALQSYQLWDLNRKKTYWFVTTILGNQVIRIEGQNEAMLNSVESNKSDIILLKRQYGLSSEKAWNQFSLPSFYLLSLKDGTTKALSDKINGSPSLSPLSKYIIYEDENRNVFSYTLNTERISCIYRRRKEDNSEMNDIERVSIPGKAIWLKSDSGLLIYDEYDIWLLDPEGNNAPINITNGFGRKEKIKFRIVDTITIFNPIAKKHEVLLTAFNEHTKQNGFFSTDFDGKEDPRRLIMGSFDLYHVSSQSPPNLQTLSPFKPIKAKNANVWIVRRQSATEFPNYYCTNDFKSYNSLSSIQPQTKFNWLTAELVEWEMFDEKVSQGILYKPENFDSTKKYPLIFNYYEKLSDGINVFLKPGYTSDNINIPYFVSNEYLVFVPDIYYKNGETGNNVYNSVVSAAKYLIKSPWIDSTKMAIQGHSFGGYETNYLITHTNMFAAAAAMSGVSDMVSDYGTLGGYGQSSQNEYETGQYRIGSSLWERSDLYIKNSPIFYVEKITTPVLLMNNKADKSVSFGQGVEFITALRRLKKTAWMLQYDRSAHQLGYEDSRDYTIRFTQFFDHYLKNAPAPIWMTHGIPARLKGTEMGYAYDPSGNCGKDCKVCKHWNDRYKKDFITCWREIGEKTKSEHWIGDGK